MLNSKMMKTVGNVTKILIDNGWSSCNEDKTVLTKDKTFIFFDEPTELQTSFQYTTEAPPEIEEPITPLFISTLDVIPNTSWRMEYEGIIISFGKIPTVFSGAMENLSESNLQAVTEFIKTIEDTAKNAENVATMSPAKYVATSVNKVEPCFTEITSLDEMGDMTVIFSGGDKPYIMLKKINDIYVAVPTQLQQNGTKHSWVVHPDFIAKKQEPPVFKEEEIYEILKDPETKMLNVGQHCVKSTIYKWKPGDNLKLPEKSITDVLDIEVDNVQAHFLNLAYDNKLNVARLVQNNYDAVTLKWLIKFLMKGYNTYGITTSLNEASLSVLYDIASGGFFINKYTNPDLSVEMIQNLHNQFLSGFSKREEMLLEQGYSKDSTEAILKIASRGDGISHVMHKEPSIKLYLRDYAFTENVPIIADYLLQNGLIENTIISAMFETMPPHVKEEVVKNVDCLGDTKVQGVPWREFCGLDKIQKVIFRSDLKLLIVTDKGYIKRGRDYVQFKTGLITTDVCITCINGKVIIED